MINKLLILHEGRKLEPYKDSLGYWTIGVGHLIDRRRGKSCPSQIPLTCEECDLLLAQDISEHKAELDRALPWASTLDEVRYTVLLDMVFNLGIEPFDNDGFKDWPNFLAQVKGGRFDEAAVNMLSTLWAKQVKQRALRLSEMMRTGRWPPGLE